MTWNYRVIKDKDKSGDIFYAIHDVYYENYKIQGWSENPSILISDDAEDLCDNFKLIEQAFDKPLLEVKGEKLVEYKRQIEI